MSAEALAVLAGKRRSAIVAGDCLDVLRALPDDSFHAIVTDPPYGLSAEPDAAEVLQHWLAGDSYEHKSAGFMGKTWDSFVPGPEYWREISRVLKPGGHLLAFAATRTWDLMSIAIRLAGLENRDTIRVDGPPAIGWKYSQGFLKGLDVGKAIDEAAGAEREVVGHRLGQTASDDPNWNFTRSSVGTIGTKQVLPVTAPATPQAAEWEGWNTNLRPSWEAILIFRKPISEANIAANVLRHGTGGFNVSVCRVGFASAEDEREAKEKNRHADFASGAEGNFKNTYGKFNRTRGEVGNYDPTGRLPQNAVIVHDPRCERVGTKRVVGTPPQGKKPEGTRRRKMDFSMTASTVDYTDEDGLETVEDWRCVEGCPALAMGERSRFYPQFGWDEPDAPFLYEAKAAANEKLLWCRVCRDAFPVAQDERHAHGRDDDDRAHLIRHVTQKPLGLVRWLVKLCTPRDGVVLDPFAGSGTTGVACSAEGFRFVGVELDPEHAATARRRIEDDAPLFAAAERRAAEGAP